MLFLWIDLHTRLDDERASIVQGSLLDGFDLSLSTMGSVVTGIGRSGVDPAVEQQDGRRWTGVWGRVFNDAELLNRVPSTERHYVENTAALIALLIDRLGPEVLGEVNGQFALVQRTTGGGVVAAVDRFSTLPLRVYRDDHRLIIASDARMILACPNVRDSLNPQAVYDYVAMSIIPSPWTVYSHIRKLPAGHVLTADDRGEVCVKPYWRPAFPGDATDSAAVVGERLRRSLACAVALRRQADPSDASVGAFLSGGLDSSTVVGLLAGAGDRRVKAFSVGFAESRFDEMEYARLAASHFNAEHHTCTVTAADTARAIDDILDVYDEPFGNSSAVPVYWCARMAREVGVDTLYGGDGGDEIFAGNPHYLMNRYFQVYHTVPGWLRRGLIEPLVFGCPAGDRLRLIRKGRSYICRANTPNPMRLAGYEFLEMTPPADVFAGGFLSQVNTAHPLDVRRGYHAEAAGCDELYRLLRHDLALVVADNDIRKVTLMSARAGVRVVYPMLDPDVITLAGSIPAAWHLRGFQLRTFYKRAMKGFLPEKILSKEKKGFGLPVSVWLKTDSTLRQRVGDAFGGRAAGEVFQKGFLPTLFRRMEEDSTNYHGAIVWIVLILLEWFAGWDRRGKGIIWEPTR